VKKEDFDACKDIFIHEVEMMLPKLIVALGNNVYTYLTQLQKDNKILNNVKIIKVPHPASILYNGTTPDGYRTFVEMVVKNAYT
jgi:uracil-DNA glycosylase